MLSRVSPGHTRNSATQIEKPQRARHYALGAPEQCSARSSLRNTGLRGSGAHELSCDRMLGGFASALRYELMLRNRQYAQGRLHVESYGEFPVIVYCPENGAHGNFYEPAYAAISGEPMWMRRFDKIHAQGRFLPKSLEDPGRRWRELDSSMSSDALLMNVFCAPGVTDSVAVKRLLGVDDEADEVVFGWKARVPLAKGRFDRTEVDMRWGNLLVEAKLTESDFQCREAALVEAYRDFEVVFDPALLPKIEMRTRRRREAVELAEEFTQEWEPPSEDAGEMARAFQAELEERADREQPTVSGYGSYQLIRNVLAAYSAGASFCVIHDERRPDLREAWFQVMAAVRNAEMRVRCRVLTWQELATVVPEGLREFLEVKYGIVAPGCEASAVDGAGDLD